MSDQCANCPLLRMLRYNKRRWLLTDYIKFGLPITAGSAFMGWFVPFIISKFIGG